jgi:SMC interacting uncharacterized protein involved in chromosome segregation
MNLKSKETELKNVRDELQELFVKRGKLLRLSHLDPKWIRENGKIPGWEREIEKLREKEQSLLEGISEAKSSDEFLKEMFGKSMALQVKRDKLRIEYEKLTKQLAEMPAEIAEHILNDGDPLKMATEYRNVKDRFELVMSALELCTLGSKKLSSLQKIPYQSIHAQNWPKDQKLDTMSEDQLRAMQK